MLCSNRSCIMHVISQLSKCVLFLPPEESISDPFVSNLAVYGFKYLVALTATCARIFVLLKSFVDDF
jgi:hypothetical protein